MTLAVPPGSITAGFLAKEPGAQMRLGTAEMTFRYADSPGAANALEGYQRLLLDAMVGDQSLFTSDAAIERLWEISAPLLDNPPPIQPYARGSWGPQPALDHLTAPYHWHLPPAGSPPETPSRQFRWSAADSFQAKRRTELGVPGVPGAFAPPSTPSAVRTGSIRSHVEPESQPRSVTDTGQRPVRN